MVVEPNGVIELNPVCPVLFLKPHIGLRMSRSIRYGMLVAAFASCLTLIVFAQVVFTLPVLSEQYEKS
mgnify:CR=1 FL=1